jgi:Xaa-Pro aminopeptidase
MPTDRTDRTIRPGDVYLVDSGGQYPFGTTDVTRTLAVGVPDAQVRDRYTRVLKAHMALSRAVFPAGTRGSHLDAIARQHLWAAGLDYAHGTGHGVGAYLAVHEGPQVIAAPGSFRGDDAPLAAGMILSIEPAYYRQGAYGIRLENLALVAERPIAGGELPMLGFEPLTMAPFDRSLIDPRLLTPDEVGWLDAYHARVRREIGPDLDRDERAWLDAATRPLSREGVA